MALPHRKSGHRKRRSREARRIARDRKIFAKLRQMAATAKAQHLLADEPLEPLSVFYGKPDRPSSWELSSFPMDKQDNGRPMPKWEDLSQWMKVTLATIVCHEWDLLTFNMNLHPTLEAELVARGRVRSDLSERVRKHLTRVIGARREFFFVLQGHEKTTGAPTHLHIHGAIAAYGHEERKVIKEALAKAAGHGIRGRRIIARAAHAKWFETFRVAYPNYLFKFSLRRDPRLDERRLVMSHSMTRAAKMFWQDIAKPE